MFPPVGQPAYCVNQAGALALGSPRADFEPRVYTLDSAAQADAGGDRRFGSSGFLDVLWRTLRSYEPR